MKHTPGPWKVLSDATQVLQVVTADPTKETPITDWCGIAKRGSAAGKANARLIAAAPELLEALKLADERLLLGKPYTGGDDDGLHQIRAAIAKAEAK